MNTTDIYNEVNYTTETSEQLNARYSRELLPLTISLGLLTALGILGNILTLLVFTLSKEYRRNTFRVFVIAVAMIDLITCVTLFPTEMLTHRYYFAFQDSTLCKTKCFLTVFGASASSLALLVISADRFRKVMTPLRKQLSPSLTVKVLFLVIFIIPVLISIPASIMCGIHTTTKTNIYGGESEIHFCETEERFKTSIWRTIYKFVLMILQLGISCVYVILYSFVMKEALKHIRSDRARQNLNLTLSESKPLEETDKKNDTRDKYETDMYMENGNESIEISDALSKEALQKRGCKVEKTKSLSSKQSKVSVLSQQTKFPAKTLVWFVLTLIFIVTYMIHLVLTLKVSEVVNMSAKHFFWFLLSFRLYFINHVINPVVYAVFLKSFRTSCRHIIMFNNKRKNKHVTCFHE